MYKYVCVGVIHYQPAAAREFMLTQNNAWECREEDKRERASEQGRERKEFPAKSKSGELR